MKLILLQNIKKLGKIGDVVEVASGYGINFLIPKKKAKLYYQGFENEIETLKVKYEKERRAMFASAQELASQIKDFVLQVKEPANEEGKLYASVTPEKISEAMSKEGFKLDPDNVILKEHIKEVGNYEIPLELANEVKSILKISVSGTAV